MSYAMKHVIYLQHFVCLCFRWINSLMATSMAVTTVNHYLKNTNQFLKYMMETPPKGSRLSKRSMRNVIRELTASLRSLVRGVVLHQIKVKDTKEGELLTKSALLQCRSLAKVAIPDVLSKLFYNGANIT